MDKSFIIGEEILKVRLRPHIISLHANYALRNLVHKSFRDVETLCFLVLEAYEKEYGQIIKVGMNSFIVEVLGHVYAYKILLFLRKIYPLGIFKKYSYHACTIECGDRQYDTNRWFWDMISFLKPVIFLFIPQRKEK
ncbi:MAG TPA: hypothetical protein PKE30_06175 [Niabella sp.]|nr:hypothetical protein [Niabella sp.]